MTIDQFIASQCDVVAEHGLQGYLPSLMVETHREIAINVLTENFDDAEVEQVARSWAERLAARHNYFLSFRANESQIKVIARIAGTIHERLVTITGM